MPLSFIVENLEAVAEPLRELYTKGDDGKFRLQTEGSPEGYVAETEVGGLRSALQKERDANKDATKKLKSIEGLNIEELRALQDRIANDEDLKLINEGKHDDVFNRRTEKLRTEHAKQLETLQEQQKQALEAEQKKSAKFQRKVIENSIRAAITEVADVHSQVTGVVRDILANGSGLFSLDDEGDVVMRREDGSTIIGKDGKTPFNAKEWLEGRRDDSPHWFKASGSGTNAPNTRGSNSGKKTMSRAAFEQLPAVEKRDFVRVQGGLVVD